MDGLYMIMNDRLTEYPLVINTLKRFNLYPEVRWLPSPEFQWNVFMPQFLLELRNELSLVLQVVLASWYRAFTSTMDFFGFPTKMCWTINRGEGLDPVESCEGIWEALFDPNIYLLLNIWAFEVENIVNNTMKWDNFIYYNHLLICLTVLEKYPCL